MIVPCRTPSHGVLGTGTPPTFHKLEIITPACGEHSGVLVSTGSEWAATVQPSAAGPSREGVPGGILFRPSARVSCAPSLCAPMSGVLLRGDSLSRTSFQRT